MWNIKTDMLCKACQLPLTLMDAGGCGWTWNLYYCKCCGKEYAVPCMDHGFVIREVARDPNIIVIEHKDFKILKLEQ